MSSRILICKQCGHRQYPRYSIKGRYYKNRRRCSICGGSHFQEITRTEDDELRMEGYLNWARHYKGKEGPRIRKELNEPFIRERGYRTQISTATHPRSQRESRYKEELPKRAAVEKPIAVEEKTQDRFLDSEHRFEILDSGPKHPECFGDHNIYSNIQKCFDCEFTDQCRNKIREMKK